MAPRLTHIALHVRDVEACVSFYGTWCGLVPSHRRDDHGRSVVWLAEPGREHDFVIVLIPGGLDIVQAPGDFSHLGFALPSHAAVDAIAARAAAAGLLVWPAVQEPWPVGYYCGIRAPDGHIVEFSFGQPLGDDAS